MQRLLRKISADTLALIIFSVTTGIFGLWFERSVVGLSVMQMIGIRVGYNVVKYLFGEICAEISDALRTRLMGSSTHPFRRALADGLALSAYQVPLYVGCAFFAHASPLRVVAMVCFYLVNNLMFGWLYGAILDRVRRRFAVSTVDF